LEEATAIPLDAQLHQALDRDDAMRFDEGPVMGLELVNMNAGSGAAG
jgi:hypothetical protein